MAGRLFTSESVTEGHPDKIADAISDSVLDALLEQDPGSRVAVETLLTTGVVVVAGEVATTGYVDVKQRVREKILEIGYDSSEKGFDGHSCGVMVAIGGQSGDIAQGVDTGHESRTGSVDAMDKQGAGDQGLMFGYACDDTDVLMPLPIVMAQRLAERLTAVRKDGTLPYLRPDGKTQVTIEYDADDRAVRVDTVVLSTQHAEDVELSTLEPDVKKHVVDHVLEAFDLPSEGYRLLVNPTGRFVVGGPMGDAGLTGRKIIVDTYGGMARHGGGAFSGKDPSKVDRSAAYAMRWVAKNVVAAGLARRCEVQVAYAIGKAQPVGVFVQTFGTGTVSDERIQDAVLEVFDLRPAAILRDLDLLRPIYAKTRPTATSVASFPSSPGSAPTAPTPSRPRSASDPGGRLPVRTGVGATAPRGELERRPDHPVVGPRDGSEPAGEQMVAPRGLSAEHASGGPVELLHDDLRHPLGADRRWRGDVHPGRLDRVVVDRRVDAARRHVDDAQPPAVDVLHHQLAGQRPHPPLAHDVRRHLRDGDVSEQRADDHQHPPVLVAQDGHDVAGEVRGARQVGGQHPVEHLGGRVLDPAVGDLSRRSGRCRRCGRARPGPA